MSEKSIKRNDLPSSESSGFNLVSDHIEGDSDAIKNGNEFFRIRNCACRKFVDEFYFILLPGLPSFLQNLILIECRKHTLRNETHKNRPESWSFNVLECLGGSKSDERKAICKNWMSLTLMKFFIKPSIKPFEDIHFDPLMTDFFQCLPLLLGRPEKTNCRYSNLLRMIYKWKKKKSTERFECWETDRCWKTVSIGLACVTKDWSTLFNEKLIGRFDEG